MENPDWYATLVEAQALPRDAEAGLQSRGPEVTPRRTADECDRSLELTEQARFPKDVAEPDHARSFTRDGANAI